MNPFQRLASRFVNWWRGAPQDTGGVRTLNSQSFLESLGLRRKRKPTSEVTYFTCLKMLSETLAKMPVKYYQKTDRGIVEAEQTETSKLLTKRPNPFMTPTVFWNTVEMNRNHYGNAYVYMRKKFIRKRYGGEFHIIDLWVMQSNCVQIVVDDAGIFAGVGRLWYVYADPTSGRQYVFSTDEVMHFKTSFSFDGITGLPVQQILKDTVSGASASQDFMNKMYESGLTAKATLEYTGELNEGAKEALRQSFEEFGSGAKNVGKILPVPLGMKLTPLDLVLFVIDLPQKFLHFFVHGFSPLHFLNTVQIQIRKNLLLFCLDSPVLTVLHFLNHRIDDVVRSCPACLPDLLRCVRVFVEKVRRTRCDCCPFLDLNVEILCQFFPVEPRLRCHESLDFIPRHTVLCVLLIDVKNGILAHVQLLYGFRMVVRISYRDTQGLVNHRLCAC